MPPRVLLAVGPNGQLQIQSNLSDARHLIAFLLDTAKTLALQQPDNQEEKPAIVIATNLPRGAGMRR